MDHKVTVELPVNFTSEHDYEIFSDNYRVALRCRIGGQVLKCRAYVPRQAWHSPGFKITPYFKQVMVDNITELVPATFTALHTVEAWAMSQERCPACDSLQVFDDPGRATVHRSDCPFGQALQRFGP